MPRQLVLPLDYGMLIKETAPVRLLDAVLEELDYKELQHLYSSKENLSTDLDNIKSHCCHKDWFVVKWSWIAKDMTMITLTEHPKTI